MAREREFVEEGIKKADIKEFLRDSLQKAKFGGVDIRRTALRTRMIIYAERPGLIIGRRGRNIKDLTEVLENRYGFENLQIEVEEIPIPELSPQIMASRIAAMLKAGRPFRRSAYMNLSKIMEAGAQGVEITISGKIRGERARTVRFVSGAITKCGEPAKQVQEGLAVADLKQGMMGIKIKIMPPDIRMPDYVDLEALEEKAKTEAAEAAESGGAESVVAEEGSEVPEEGSEIAEEGSEIAEEESVVAEEGSEVPEEKPEPPEEKPEPPEVPEEGAESTVSAVSESAETESSSAEDEPEAETKTVDEERTELKIEVTEVPMDVKTSGDESKEKESGSE